MSRHNDPKSVNAKEITVDGRISYTFVVDGLRESEDISLSHLRL